MRMGHEGALDRPRGLLPLACETSIERARRGMRPEAGARYADSVRGRALHNVRKNRIGRTRSPYARPWNADGRLPVLMPARRIAPLWAVCEAGVISDRRARCDVFERTRRCALMFSIISQRLLYARRRPKHGAALVGQSVIASSARE